MLVFTRLMICWYLRLAAANFDTITLGGTQASIDKSTTDVINFLNAAFAMSEK